MKHDAIERRGTLHCERSGCGKTAEIGINEYGDPDPWPAGWVSMGPIYRGASPEELAKRERSAMGRQGVFSGQQVYLHEGGVFCSPDHVANSLNDAAIRANRKMTEAVVDQEPRPLPLA